MLLYAWVGVCVMHNDPRNKLNHAKSTSLRLGLALRYTFPTCLRHVKIKDKFILTLMSDHILHIHIGFCMRNDIDRRTVSNDLTW
jgi:hypothetical protein